MQVENFMERRLQTQVFKLGLAKSIHHARILVKQRHIRCVSFAVRHALHRRIPLAFCCWDAVEESPLTNLGRIGSISAAFASRL